MSLFRAYKYFFYRTYVWQLEMFGEQNNPKFVAICANSMMIGFHILSILLLFQIVTGVELHIGKVFAAIGALLLLLINYFILLYSKRSDPIIAEFSSESSEDQKRRSIWCWVYVISTFVVFFGLVLSIRLKLR